MEERGSIFSPVEPASTVTSSAIDTMSTVSGSLCSPTPNLLNNPLSLTEVWEIYIRTVKSQDQSADNVERQSMLLDLLLHMCTLEIKHGALPTFSDMKSVCNQLCKEFMTDILHITNKSEDDDSSQLQHYLLEGRGFQLLQVIYKKGVQNVSGGRDLANLLVSLLPWCLKFPSHSDTIPDPDLSHIEKCCSQYSISQCFQRVYKSSQSRTNQQRFQAMPCTRHTHKVPRELSSISIQSKHTNNKRFSKRKSTEVTSKDYSKVSDGDSSDVQVQKTKEKVRRKSRYYHIHSTVDRLEQQKVESDSDDDDLYDLLKTVQKEEIRICGLELCVLILNLLFELSSIDLNETSPGKLISLRIMPQLLQCLKSINGEESAERATDFNGRARQILCCLTLRVLFSCCAIVSTQSNGTNILTSHKVVETVLTIGHKYSIHTNQTDYTLHSKHLDIVCDSVIGLLHCLVVVFDHLPFNPSFIKSAVGLLEMFDDHGGFQLLHKCVMYHDWLKTCSSEDNAVWPEDEPLKVFSTYLSTMKIVRVNYLHSMKCVKRKHQKCTYTQYFDHHHDILGVPVRKQSQSAATVDQQDNPTSGLVLSDLPDQTACLVASSTQFLLDLLLQVQSKSMRLDLVKTIYSAGVCCCMDLQDIISAFVGCVGKFSPAVRTFTLDALNKVILDHFSGSMASSRRDFPVVSCGTCDTGTINNRYQSKDKTYTNYISAEHKLTCLEMKGLDSGFDSSNTTKEKVSALQKISKWKPVGQLKCLLYSSDESLATSVAKHLMVLAIKGNPFLKAELFFSVYINALELETLETNEQREVTSQSLAKTVQVHCLSALPYVLQANCVTQAFLSKNGVKKLCQLLEDDVLRIPVLRIFEALVVQDEYKLLSAPDNSQAECPCPYKAGAVIETFVNELSKRSFDMDIDSCRYNSDGKPRRIRHDSVVLSKFSLPVLVDLWHTCARLCLNNHSFVTLFQDSQNMYLYKTETLLLETLDILTSPSLIGYLQSHGSTETEDSGMETDHIWPADLDQSDCVSFNLRLALLESLMVVVGSCYDYMEKQNYSSFKTWSQMQDRFKQPLKLKATKVKAMLDTVLNAAMPQLTSVLGYSYHKNIALVYMRDDDIYDEDEVRQLLHSGSEEELEVTNEIGYDGDSEETMLDDKEKDKYALDSLMKSGSPYKVYFPATFRLLFELLIELYKQDTDCSVIHAILHKLVQTVRADPKLVSAMCKQDILSLILSDTGFWPYMLTSDSELSVRDNLLVMVQYLGQHKLKSCDLQKILQLFQHSSIPMEQLLPVVHSIVERSEPIAHYSLTFPSKTNNISGDTARDALTPTLDCISSSVSPLLKAASSILKLPVGKSGEYEFSPKFQQQEIWGLSPIQLKLGDALAWPPFQNGFTLALWLRLEADNKHNYSMDMPMFDLDSDDFHLSNDSSDMGPVSRCLHVVSIGTTEKLMEIWAETATNSLIFRLTSEVCEMGLVVREMKLEGVMSPARWQHLVVCYVESLDGSTLTGKTTVIIDGWQNHSFVLDHPFSAIKARHRSSSVLNPALCLGHMVPNPCLSQVGTVSLGSLYLFKGASMKKEHCFHLYTLGPNCDSLLKCDCSEDRALYSPHLHKNTILHSKISHDSLVGLSEVDLADLRGSVLLSYNPRNCQDMLVYPALSRSIPGQVAGTLAYTPDNLLTQHPRTETPILLSNLSVHMHYSLEKALEESGGMAAILFLVAKVYERCPESMPTDEAERIQAEAVRVLLSVVHHSSQLQAEYKDCGGHALLCKVLTSCRRVVGKQILKVLMDAATTESLFKICGTNLVIRQRSDVVIRDVTIIDQIILEWQVWEGSSHGLLELLFGALAHLIREDHPHQQFNIKQYQVINLVSKIFKVYQERIQEGFPALPITVSQNVVSILQNMIGSPPDPHLIIEICDFLLMVHPAANTYINHSRSSFYFMLPWGLPPSPLTKWRQDLEITGAITSTPRKHSTTPTDDNTKKSKVHATQDLTAKLEAETPYPQLDITKRSSLEHDFQMVHIGANNLVLNDKKTQQETALSYKSEHSNTEVGDTISTEYSSNILSQHRIPENFASLYKKMDSVDGHDSPHSEEVVEAIESVDRSVSDQSISDVTEEGNDGTDISISKEDLSLNFDEDNMEMLKQEQGLTALCVGLLRMLSSVIVMMPDTQVEKTFQKSIINPQTFIVLMQSSSSEIREAVIKVIDAYLSRSSSSHTDVFLKMEGFQLMSAQLYQYPTHQEQMEAAVSIVMQRPFLVDEGLHEEEIIEDLSQIQQAAIPVMLALLGNSTGDLALCHNSLQFFNKLFETSDIVAVVMMEQGLVEVLCNMLQKLFDNGNRCTDVEGMDENEILLGDLLDFFKVIAVKEFSVSGPQHYQNFEDIIVLLQDMEKTEKDVHGEKSKSCQTLRRFQYHLLVSVIEVVEKMSEECSSQSAFSLFPKIASRAPQYAEGNSLLHVASSPSLPPHRNFSIPAQHFSLSGAFSRFTMPSRKSHGSFFIQSDHPYHDSGPSGGSSGDSDNSQDSWQNSVQSVNLPVGKPGYLRSKSNEIGQGKLLRNNSLLQTVLSIGKRKKLSTSPISQKELIERLKKLVLLAVDTALFSDRKPGKQRKEVFLFEMGPRADSMDGDFLKRLFIFCYRAFETTLPQEKNSYKRTKNTIVWGAKDILRIQLGRLLALMLSDRQEREIRVYALSFIIGEFRGVDILKMLIGMPEVANDLAYHVRNLMTEGRQLMAKQQIDDGAKLMNHISAAGYMVISAQREPSRDQKEMLEERKRLIYSKHGSEKAVWIKRKENALNRIIHRHDSLSVRLCDTAMEVTQSVTQLQTRERTKFITHIKHKKTQSIQVKKQWQEIVQNLTHERAVWHDEESYPKSWQLNPTEGPCRVRKRLQRGHLGILPRFLMKDHQSKLASETVDPPLIYLFEDDHQMSDSAALIYQLHKNNKIRYTCSCRAVSPNSESKGELLIGEESVFFVADEAITDANYTQVLLGNKDQLSMTWPFEDVLEINKRWYELMDTAIEIFLTNGKTCLLAFKTTKERDELFRHLNQLELPNKIFTGNLMDVIYSWENRNITNFEYLTYLNKLAGRSFNDLMQYPIMPFILRDYTSDKLDLEQRSIYRDLTKPVSVQEPKNEQKFMMNYAVLKQEYDKLDKSGITSLRVAPYHYGSHYSNSGCVLHFLVRLPPFTKMFLNFQDQNFDIPDRTFHNLHTSWRLSSAESNTDVKELIPEFFFCHEIFRNFEGFDFGLRQNGERVHGVVLPPWCGGNPRLFTLIHRQALESDHVTETLGSWIDLVFGAKQQGEAAVRAINVFHPATYYGLDVSTVKNPVDRKAIQTMVRTYGQTPKQLFTIQHSFKRTQDSNKPEHSRQASRPPQIKGVSGLKWGSYLGSPDRPAPSVCWESRYPTQVASLVALPKGLVFGIGAKSCLLLQHSQDKEKALVTDTQLDVVWAAILTWNQPDGILKIVNTQNKPPVNLLRYCQSDEISCCVSVPDCRYLVIGGSSGVITVYSSKYNPAKESQIQVFDHKRCLYGHIGSVQALVVCKPYSILVSASQDGTCIIWDLNRLSYVRSITGHKSGVQVLAVSDTLGDIASVCHHGLGSYLYVHTVNAEHVAMTTCEDTINCLAYSTAPEGASINVIAGGLSTGVIRMWSSWDLAPVRDLKHSALSATPIISLAFTKDSQRLFMSSADGRVTLWDYSRQTDTRSPRFKSFLIPT